MGKEPFRTFTTSDGKSFPFQVLSYEGQEFYFQDKSEKRYKVNYKQFSAEDQKYLISVAQEGKIPKGDPRFAIQEEEPPPPVAADAESENEMPEEEVTAAPSMDEGERLMAAPKKKPKLRNGSFFAYKPVKLGQDPNLALEEKGGGLPKEGEAIDFSRHVLPILEDRCFSCHQEPYDKNGRTIQPKAGLALNTYELVMKGNLDNTVVTAGDVADSYLHEVLVLDEDDDMFMPPKGGPLTTEQIDIIKRWIEEGAKEKAGGGGGNMDGGISFHDHIFPLLEERCIDCHGEPYVKNGRTIQPKAGLALNTYELVLKGNLDGAIITRGNHEESTLYAVITLDPDDPEIMPPKGDPLTEEEVEMFKKWINEGAKEYPSDVFEKPKEEKSLASLTPTDSSKIPLVDLLGKKVGKPNRIQLETASKTGALVTLLSEKHSLVRAEFTSGPSLVEDKDVDQLSAVSNNISHLDLSRTQVTDQSLGFVKKLKNLTWLGLRNTKVTDSGIKQLKDARFLRYLNLSGTEVSDRSIDTLAGLKDIEEIYLWNSKVSESGANSLRKALPNAKIIF